MKDFYTIENGKAVHYVRTGECNKCGECCGIKNTITYLVEVRFNRSEEDQTQDWKEDDWSAWEGYTLFFAQGLWWYFKVTEVSQKEEPQACGSQDQDTQLCKIWDDVDKLPAICRYWPFRQSDLEQFPKCGYTFTKQEDKE